MNATSEVKQNKDFFWLSQFVVHHNLKLYSAAASQAIPQGC